MMLIDPDVVNTRWAIGVCSVLGSCLVFWVARAVYRVYLHPLKNFPGPKAAAVSGKWLYEITKDGRPDAVYEQLHYQLGTATNPNCR
jgi:hypothetical protein